ncbi:HdeD family acid-resistance protein [Gordonia sp. (in: high G+C Gram-positive bacteria)]|uniref:HdeD family acid-resistance protein n=1 Tax=Gordonia sp. (in: high G+C Gram-positive bacteria) TaxID=84139 RepID=UPI003F977A06
MTVNSAPSALPDAAVNAVRSFLITTSVVGIALGVVALVWPGATLAVVAVLFGAALVVTGLLRLFVAFATTSAPFGSRMLLAVFGVIVLAAGVLAILSPAESLTLLGIFIGVGWIFSGFQDLFGARMSVYIAPRWLVILSGIVSVLAGIAMIVLPAVATLGTILWILAIMLIAVSVATLLTLPAKRRSRLADEETADQRIEA